MQEIRSSVDIDEYIKQEMSKPVKGTGMTEIELIEKILSKKEEIISKLDERSFATCLTDLGQYLTDLVEGKVYAWQTFLALGWENLIGTYVTCITDVPWEWDAIFVTCLLGFFGILVTAGTVYDIAYRRRRLVVSVEASPVQRERPKQNGKHDVIRNVYNDEDNDKKHEESSFHHDSSSKDQSQQQLYMTPEEERELAQKESAKGTKLVDKENKLGNLLTSFSVVYNCDKILNAKKNSSSLSCLNGIRVLSMFWVIWGHSNQFPVYGRLDNAEYQVDNVFSKYRYNSLVFGTYSVDSFFVLSGLLVTYLTLKELKANKGKLNWFLYYFHRFWRLTPVYMITIGIYTALLVHLGTGSMKIERARYDRDICVDYWWTNLLYINNFRRTSKLGIASVIAMCVSSIIVTATLTGYYGLPVGKSFQYYNDRMLELPNGTNSDVVYGKPWCRIQSYMVGVFVGYFLYRHVYIKKIRMHWLVSTVGWFLAIGIMYTMLYALHGTSNQDPPPQWFSAVWGGVCRTLFSMGVAWVAFACSTGYGGLINSFLSWSFWTPMARLTYCAYLLHPIVILEFLRTKKVSYHWTFPEVVYFTFANIVVSYVCALGLSLLVESPTVGIEKAIFGKKKKK
ncbi:Nose resistant to fluoxetine protein 6 [Holothuria leucospilota]|uniref:Nose resistant to fluoxetine protein 6 n=1 Tax=Holothuria leucospilota TaxID=206669 RepID=A0A9Q0YJN3_HOLLE|nr:Nose resistant to fluoxetine protein 6 [Holothuria leucospilota]